MKLNEIHYKTIKEIDELPRFDMKMLPLKAKWYLRPVSWLLSFPENVICNTKIHKKNMRELNKGYLLLCNHNSFTDFKVLTKAIFPRPANYVVAIDGFINREKLLRNVGGICKRKFISDINIIRQIKHSVIDNEYICALYPEARYSLVGTNAILPPSLGKMIKYLNVPVATFICHGNHLRQPVWNLHKNKVKINAYLERLLTSKEIKKLSVDEINEKINQAFIYDDFKYQKEKNIHNYYNKRAEGLNSVLYQCPSCHVEHKMYTKDNYIWCDACGKKYEMDTLGRLKALEGVTEFSHIPDWYEWERSQVREQIESGKYRLEMKVDIDSLPNSKGFYRIGKGSIVHDYDGFNLHFKNGEEELIIHKSVLENYSIHIEYNYAGKGDAFSFSTFNDTYYLFPIDRKDIITKIHFAVEELYKIKAEEIHRNKK
ncbi:MAG: hypothetical protein WC278_05390 [Bacilli bacterium]|jgi:1-acyl-sn-glycerol-3-phosphate acyltransferase|nr:hypothetical protein [Bacilli bacterium]MDD3121512.1 hypothetical protein [Bacilli bacterium]MDD4482262.1 hypothetical protein [Bacilli bacterium]